MPLSTQISCGTPPVGLIVCDQNCFAYSGGDGITVGPVVGEDCSHHQSGTAINTEGEPGANHPASCAVLLPADILDEYINQRVVNLVADEMAVAADMFHASCHFVAVAEIILTIVGE